MRSVVAALALACAVALASAQSQPSIGFKTDIAAAQVASAAASAPGSVNTAAATIGVNEKIIDSGVQDIAWVGDEHSDTVFVQSVGKMLYRSGDGGKTWVSQMHLLQKLTWQFHPSETIQAVTSMIKSPADPNMVFFTGDNGMHLLTRDGGATYEAVGAAEKLGEIRLHPKNTDMMLAAGLSERCGDRAAAGACYKRLFASLDGGKNWKMLHDYVVQFEWAHSMRNNMAGDYPQETIIYSALVEKKGTQRFGQWDHRVDLFITEDLFVNSRTIVKRGNRFLFTDLFLAIAQVDARAEHVSLVLSSDGGRHTRLVGMPYDIRQHSYTILDTSEGTVFLHVNHLGEKSKWGNVYASNALGTNFSLSLPYNRRDENGKCDFEKLQSLEGVYVANYYDNADEIEAADQHFIGSSSMGQDSTPSSKAAASKGGKAKRAVVTPVVRTVITFDKGGVWEYLNPPRTRANGAPIRCPAQGKHCSLHLHGVTDVFGPFYATESAVGMMMATGCVGDRLCFREGSINTYLSRDGGHEWYEVAEGSHIYEFGDHGGIIVMAFDERPVTSIQYSWDEGATWESYDFTTTPVLIDNIMIEPGATSTRFLVYGTRESSNAARIGAIFHVDFADLHQRACVGVDVPDSEESDYETWTPSAGPNQDGCLLGHKVQYVRRKRLATCFNGEELERSRELSHCECTEMDFECDVGYKRDLQGGPCVRDLSVPATAAIPMNCPAGATYMITDGYRKVSGDTCAGGVTHPGVPTLCPDSSWHHNLAPSRWILLIGSLTVAIGLCAVQYSQSVGSSRPKGWGPATAGCMRFTLTRIVSVSLWALQALRDWWSGKAGRRGAGSSGWGASGKPAFGGSMAGGSAGAPASAEYKAMRADADAEEETMPWDDDGALVPGEGDDFRFTDGDGEDGGDAAIDAAFADLGVSGDDDLLALPVGGAAPTGAAGGASQVPKLRAPRVAKSD
ncbi:hypothetical protein FNF27_01514 [Cafeteria roenbergensis]|nr:hypothetical protein FNF31_06262 [Cafeteria roenbergensis]KAA0167031.1 hypothetical protein FNF28_02954 [Cafeteria roenbergensis]KAA0177185.1 hypothetical protein FNF27_01514 [Cafeteria roenbergensis]